MNDSLKDVSLENLRLTIVVDNRGFKEGLDSSWGFSCLIEGPEKSILFDTGGDGELLMSNMAKLKVDLEKIDLIVLSHDHWDHTGGLESFLSHNNNVKTYMPKSFSKEIRNIAISHKTEIIYVDKEIRICPSVYSTGEMGVGIKEQSLILQTTKGVIVITGCAHPGIDLIVQKAKKITQKDILYVLGGFHLLKHNREQIEAIVKTFRELGVKYVSPCHCSGENAQQVFKEIYQQNFIDIGAGKIINLTDLK